MEWIAVSCRRMVDPPGWQHELHARFYARFRQVSMCRPIETAGILRDQLLKTGKNSGFSAPERSWIGVGLSHKFIEAVDHKLSGWRVVNECAPLEPAL